MNEPEHFVSCVQVKVTGGGSGTPGPTVQFPGAYKSTDEYANFSIYNGFKNLTMPGPAVWTGGSSSVNANVAAASVTETESSPAAAENQAQTTLSTVTRSATSAGGKPTAGCNGGKDGY